MAVDPLSGDTSTTGTDTGSSWLSDVGSTLSGWGSNIASGIGTVASGVGNFVRNNAGLVGTGVAAGVGLYEAGQAQSQARNLAGQIQAAGAPAGQLGTGIIGQLRGGPSVGGQLGASITGQGQAATTLTQTAQQYASGQLTSAQQMQVDQYVKAQKAQVASQLGNNYDSSARDAAFQQIDNNAAMLAQSLVAGNVQIATGALGAVSSTYNSLIGNALSSSGLGLQATSQAVQAQIQSDQQIAQYIQQLMSGIAQGLSGATSGGGTGQTGQQTAGGGVGGALGQAIKGFMGGGAPVAGSATGSPVTDTAASGFIWGGGVGGSDYSPGVSIGDPTSTAPTAMADPYGTVSADLSGNPDWLSGLGSDTSGLLAAGG